MKVILFSGAQGRSRSLSLGRSALVLLSLCAVGLPLVVGVAGGFMLGGWHGTSLDEDTLALLKEQAREQQQALANARRESEQQLQAMSVRLAQLQARLVRLDALGERMTTVASLDAGEFDFSQPPALGGPEGDATALPLGQPDFLSAMDELAERLDNREQQLNILETLLVNRKIEDDTFLAGRPIKKGWMSSRFGLRSDPFNGRRVHHNGVDFAGKENSEIIAVGAGVVTWSGDRYGYGLMVEINHGGDSVTRYAHNNKNLVKAGDVVKKGQVIALMGSSGRSTGPHVHFEVYKHGRPVDPASYIHRAAR